MGYVVFLVPVSQLRVFSKHFEKQEKTDCLLNLFFAYALQAYDHLESEGYVVTVHGKGTYVAAADTELLLEEQKKELEADLERAVQKGRRCGISDEDIRSLFELILED